MKQALETLEALSHMVSPHTGVIYMYGGTMAHEHTFTTAQWVDRHGAAFISIDGWIGRYRELSRCACGAELVRETIANI